MRAHGGNRRITSNVDAVLKTDDNISAFSPLLIMEKALGAAASRPQNESNQLNPFKAEIDFT